MPYRPKHQLEVAWTQNKKRWKHQAVQPQGDQTHYGRHDLPIAVARFERIESPHPSVLQIAENYRTDPTNSQPQLNWTQPLHGGGTTATPGGADDYSPHIGVNRGFPGIWDRGTIGIWFHQSKVLTSGDLLAMTWVEVT